MRLGKLLSVGEVVEREPAADPPAAPPATAPQAAGPDIPASAAAGGGRAESPAAARARR